MKIAVTGGLAPREPAPMGRPGGKLAGSRLIARGFALLLVCLCGLAEATTSSLQHLQEQVHQQASRYYQAAGAKKFTVTVGNLDSRLQLRSCVKALTIQVNDPQFNGGNQTAQVRCESETPWSIYVPFNVALYFELPVASRNLARGEEITAADVQISLVDSRTLRQGQLDRIEDIVGKAVRRPLREGEVFRQAQLELPTLVRRGDIVSIVNQSGPIAVTSTGTALAAGRTGDRIRIKNNQSDRVINAKVTGVGQVQTF